MAAKKENRILNVCENGNMIVMYRGSVVELDVASLREKLPIRSLVRAGWKLHQIVNKDGASLSYDEPTGKKPYWQITHRGNNTTVRSWLEKNSIDDIGDMRLDV